MSHKKPVSVLVVIHSPELEILLLERAAQADFWQSVTGSQEAEDDSLLATAQREVQEETGIIASAADFVDWQLANRYEIFLQWRHRYAPGVTHNTEHVFSVCVPRDTPIVTAANEHRQHRWLPWKEAALACFSWSNRDAIYMIAQTLAAAR